MEVELETMAQQKTEEHSLTKRLLFEEIEKEFSSGENLFFSRFDRLNVADMSELRRNLEKVSRRTLVVKHSFVKRILEKVKVPDAAGFLEGSVLVTFGSGEPQLVSKALVEFSKSHEQVEVKGMVLEGKVYGGSFVRELARLPSRKELLAAVACGMQSPITRLAMTLNGILRSFVSIVDETRKKKAKEAAPQPQ